MGSRFEFSVGTSNAPPARRVPGEPLRMLLIGDFSGTATRPDPNRTPLAARKPHGVDLDTLAALFARLAPCIDLPGEAAGDPTTLALGGLDDLHPERLVARIASLGSLKGLRSRLSSAATFQSALPELQALGLAPQPSAPERASAPRTKRESDAGTLERLLGQASPPAAAADPARAVEALMRDAVASHVVPDAGALQDASIAALDAHIGGRLRAILHAPGFRALESAWRGVQWLVSRLELGDGLELHLLDASRAELEADLGPACTDLAESGLCRALMARAPAERPGWSLLVGLYDVAPGDFELVATLGALAQKMGAPIILGAEATLVGAASPGDLADPRLWQAPGEDDAARWQALRESALAPWIGLVAPRILLRLPYGKRTDPVEDLGFEEQPGEPTHETLPWGSGTLAVALLVGQAFLDGGWDGLASPGHEIEQLPAYTFERDGVMEMQPCAEAWLDDRAIDALIDQGIVPLVSERHAPAVRLLQLQTMAGTALVTGGVGA
jgi:type VI secretion system ImpC/EvpB family protein